MSGFGRCFNYYAVLFNWHGTLTQILGATPALSKTGTFSASSGAAPEGVSSTACHNASVVASKPSMVSSKLAAGPDSSRHRHNRCMRSTETRSHSRRDSRKRHKHPPMQGLIRCPIPHLGSHRVKPAAMEAAKAAVETATTSMEASKTPTGRRCDRR